MALGAEACLPSAAWRNAILLALRASTPFLTHPGPDSDGTPRSPRRPPFVRGALRVPGALSAASRAHSATAEARPGQQDGDGAECLCACSGESHAVDPAARGAPGRIRPAPG